MRVKVINKRPASVLQKKRVYLLNVGSSKKRSVKVYGQSGYKYRETPTIMLKGLWLKEAGFDSGDYISVTCEDGKIIITQDAERAAVKAAEA